MAIDGSAAADPVHRVFGALVTLGEMGGADNRSVGEAVKLFKQQKKRHNFFTDPFVTVTQQAVKGVDKNNGNRVTGDEIDDLIFEQVLADLESAQVPDKEVFRRFRNFLG